MRDYFWKLTVKRGGGRGHWGHAGRPGKVGGSLPGRGAAYAREKYLRAVRDGYPKPVREAIGKAVKEAHPDVSEHGLDMYLDVMALDREKFLYYAGKLGLKDPEALADAYFKENAEIERKVAQKRWKVEGEATYKGPNGEPVALQGFWADDDSLYTLRGKDATEAATHLLDEYGVLVMDSTRDGLPRSEMWNAASYLLNLADKQPALAALMRDRVKHVKYVDKGPNAKFAARWQGNSIIVPYEANGVPLLPYLLVHEMGHAAQDYIFEKTGEFKPKGFGRGRTASRYGWSNPDEDWAEWWMAYFGNAPGLREWDPEKYAAVEAVVKELEE